MTPQTDNEPESRPAGPSGAEITPPPFFGKTLLLDLEVSGERIRHLGAVLGERHIEATSGPGLAEAFRTLDEWAEDVDFVLGHNAIEHDIPVLTRAAPRLRILGKPVIDTLFLSPLAFPENPYHRLVKDYKLVRDSINDPVRDATLAGRVFLDQWLSFSRLMESGLEDIPAFHRFCFKAHPGEAPGDAPFRGLAAVFARLGAALPDEGEAARILERHASGRVCRESFARSLAPALADPASRVFLPYVLAWLRVAGSSSVIPPWVLKRFPKIRTLLGGLRATPCADPDCAWCRESFQPEGLLRRYFGFGEFRATPATREGGSLQEAIVRAGLDERPHLAILPTGGGKSLCYQLPALARHARLGALTVILSPLQALMKDQVDNLAERTGSPCAAALSGLLTPPERGEVLERVRLGDIAILHVAPEQLRNRSFRDAIAAREIGAWVFDEAHCLSKWGHDFRPDYLYAGRFIREQAKERGVSAPPVACFTATAKQDVKREILDYFRRELGQELDVFEGGVERENLRFEVRPIRRSEKFGVVFDTVMEHLARHGRGSAIVYASTRRGVEELSEYLGGRGLACGAFHGGLNAAEKRTVQDAFLSGELQVMAATNAFGMGIDKGDVRLVLHADIPGSLESYLQEAGRAGRDLGNAECVLLYDEGDVETQFKLGAHSRLSRDDMARILRAVRRAVRNPSGEIILTAGELLRDEELEEEFDTSDRNAETKLKMAISWLEKMDFLERNENHTMVFQGRLLVKSLEEASARMAALNLPAGRAGRWMAILTAMMNAAGDRPLSADTLAELAGVADAGNAPGADSGKGSDAAPGAETGEGAERPGETASRQVIRTLHQMAEAGLLKKGLMLNAFVRHKVVNPSHQVLRAVSDLEEAMLGVLREEAPDAAETGWAPLSLRLLNQRLKTLGHESDPVLLRGMLKSISLDGRGLAGSHGSLVIRHVSMDHYRVKLLRNWDALVETSRRRRTLARVLLDRILANIPESEPPSATLLVGFSTDDLSKALRSHMLGIDIKDPLAAIDRALLYMHEQKVIILQQGLAVFRQAMSIRVFQHARGRRVTRADYEPLEQHYRERTFQVHVMNEYARLGLRGISQALELVMAYFGMLKADFIRRYFPGRKEMLARATGEGSHARIVEELRNPVQMRVVAAADDGNALVIAGPGSGKTRLVAHRCAYLVRVLRVPPEAILVVCFNHNAAAQLRKRLADILGEDARGLTVQTYHGIAMRISGTSFAGMSEAARGEALPFDRLIPDAIRMLKGETELPGVTPDEMRDRLLSSFSHILVDEYQDIDRDQYDLISALAGRTESDPDTRLRILAVGDDDQNIYTFRGANVQFIHRFREDYRAEVHYLVENYRSSDHIIRASNALISENRDRMKVDHSIRRSASRAGEPAGGRWEGLDPLARGRVQAIRVKGARGQVLALLEEWRRLRALDPNLSWGDMAVLALSRENLAPVRAACEHLGIPVTWSPGRERAPALSRLREIRRFLALLGERRKEYHRASELEAWVEGDSSRADTTGGGACAADSRGGGTGAERGTSQRSPCPHPLASPPGNPWRALLRDLLESWKDETADAELPVSHAIEWIYESLAELRRERRTGSGVFLSTVHGAKGMEFPHVFILDGDWRVPVNDREREEKRRVLYVGMTRAKETLTLFRRADAPNPYLDGALREHLFRRDAASFETAGVAERTPAALSATSLDPPDLAAEEQATLGSIDNSDDSSPGAGAGTTAHVPPRGAHGIEDAARLESPSGVSLSAIPDTVLGLRYELLGMKDVDLGYAGRLAPGHPVHRRLAALEPVALLTPRAEGDKVALLDASGHRVARLSKNASEVWLPKLDTIRHVRVVGMLHRAIEDETEDYRPRCGCESWEVPWLEIIHLPAKAE